MDKVPALHIAAVVVIGLFGLTSLTGGVIGYVKASSTASLIAGGLSGLLLLLCAAGVFRLPVWSLVAAMIVSLALLGRFAPKVIGLSEKAAGPVDYVMTVGGLLVVVVALLAVFSESTTGG